MKTQQLDHLRSILDRAKESDLSSLGKIVNQMNSIITDPVSGAGRLKQLIEVDPPLCSKVLSLANSALYSFKRDIYCVQDAIVLIGFTAIKDLVLELKVGNYFNNVTKIGHYNRRELWRHSVATAICARYIYRCEFCERGDDIYSIALLHDIGILARELFDRQFFVNVIETMSETGESMSSVEMKRCGFDHGQIGKAILNDMKLPDHAVRSIEFIHCPKGAPADIERPVYTLFVAEFLCLVNGMGIEQYSDSDEEMLAFCLDGLGIGYRSVEIIMEDVCSTVEMMEERGDF